MQSNIRYKRRRRRLPVPTVLLILLLISAAALMMVPRWLGLSGNCTGAGRVTKTAFELTPITPVSVDPSAIYSSSALLIRLSDNAVLFDKNSKKKSYPASLTKMMTALTFLEYYAKNDESGNDELERLKADTFTLPAEIFPILAARHASMAGLQPGETVSYLDLLYACHLPSGADGSMGLAYAAAGSEEGFVKLMNEKAAELGMKNTHFSNVTGLHDDQNYTTAADMAALMKYALKNQAFHRIFTAKTHQLSPTIYHPEGLVVRSTLSMKLKNPHISRTTILGGKTGYTEEAGLCLASLAKKGSQEYILITMGAPGNTRTEQFNITDAQTIYGSL